MAHLMIRSRKEREAETQAAVQAVDREAAQAIERLRPHAGSARRAAWLAAGLSALNLAALVYLLAR